MYRRFGKRLVDLLVALPIGLALAPLGIVVAVLVRCRLGPPVLFWQTRAGLNGRPFDVVKFRTMTNTTNATGALLSDEARLTRFGQFLRATSLDEIPQLWNVIRGQMSLVGPRPLLLAYVDRYNSHQRRRLEVKPGITGWAQINGRNAISWEDRFELDVWYVDHLGAGLDLRICLWTIWRLLVPSGIRAARHATMPEFMGSERE